MCLNGNGNPPPYPPSKKNIFSVQIKFLVSFLGLHPTAMTLHLSELKVKGFFHVSNV